MKAIKIVFLLYVLMAVQTQVPAEAAGVSINFDLLFVAAVLLGVNLGERTGFLAGLAAAILKIGVSSVSSLFMLILYPLSGYLSGKWGRVYDAGALQVQCFILFLMNLFLLVVQVFVKSILFQHVGLADILVFQLKELMFNLLSVPLIVFAFRLFGLLRYKRARIYSPYEIYISH